MWSNGAVFSVTGNRGGKAYRQLGSNLLDTKFIQSIFKYLDKLIVLSVLGYHGMRNLVILLRNVVMNADQNLKLLSDHLKNYLKMCRTNLFAPVNVLYYTAKLIKECFDFVQLSLLKSCFEVHPI